MLLLQIRVWQLHLGKYLRWHRGKYLLKAIYFYNTKKSIQRSKKSKNDSEIALTTY
jgi:hypothetical protein